MDLKTHFTVANTTNMRRAAFTVTGLLPGTGYIVTIASSNSKGKKNKSITNSKSALLCVCVCIKYAKI